MKAVTIAKIARLIVIIAVGLVIAVPTFAGVESMKVSNGELVMTDSVYEVSCMSANDIATNIKGVTNGDVGYTINYGNVVGRTVPTSDSDLETLGGEIKAAVPDGTATLVKPDGSVAKQQMITGTEGFTTYMFTGLKLSGSLVNTLTPTISLESAIGEFSNKKISDVDITKTDDSYRIKIKIPYILFATAVAAGEDSKIGLRIGIDYNSFFNFTFRMNVPVSKFVGTIAGSGGGSIDLPEYEILSDTTYSGLEPSLAGTPIKEGIKVEINDIISLDENVSASVGDFGGTGGIRFEVDSTNGTVQLLSDQEDLIDALESARNEDGSLTINVDGHDPIEISAEDVESLMAMSDDLLELKKMYEEAGLIP